VFLPPPIAYACNVYRRRFGVWPAQLRLHPGFAEFLVGMSSDDFGNLVRAFDVTVTLSEPSPRVSVSGEAGQVTYDDGVTEADWDRSEFDAYVAAEA
jgi:hypothetical protein